MGRAGEAEQGGPEMIFYLGERFRDGTEARLFSRMVEDGWLDAMLTYYRRWREEEMEKYREKI